MATNLYSDLANCLADLEHAGRGIACSMYGARGRVEQRCFPPTKEEYDLALSSTPMADNGTWPPILRNLRNALRHWWLNYEAVEPMLRSIPRDKVSDEWLVELSATIDSLADPLRCTLPDRWPEEHRLRLNSLIDCLLPSDWEHGLEKLGPFYDRLRAIVKTQAAATVSDPPANGKAGDDPLDTLPDEAMMNHIDLATKLGLERDALRKRLDRWRERNLNGGWQEAENRQSREPKYIYRVGSIRSVLREALASA